jgi:nucleotidyltransferase/DNA polymerase involved in DNA repair
MRGIKAIGHLDADCFYISAERVRSAFLTGKPVGVLGNQGAFVIAKSYEMKACGVKTGEPIWDALVKCPQGIYVKRDFRWYEVLSRKMLEIVREFSPRVEYYSIDEFFFEAIPLEGRSWQQTAEYIRDRLWEAVRVPVTVGIARTKTLAKLISDTAKPFGALAVLDPDLERAMLGRTPVTDVCGIAAGRGARLAAHGMTTALDMALAERRFIRELLTITGEALWYELNGEAVVPLHTKRPPHKMLARGGNIGRPTDDADYVWGWTVRSLERLIEELEYHRVKTATLHLHLVYRDGRAAAARTELLAPTDRFDLLVEAARLALRQVLLPRQVVARLHVMAGKLCWPGSTQLGLFDPPAGQAEAVAKLKHEVNAKHGRFILRSGATLFLREIYKDEAYSYEICDVREKMCF